MKRIIFLMCSFCCVFAHAQLILPFQKTYGGSSHEYTNKTIPTSDGGYAFVGFSESNDCDVSVNHGSVDLWVGKLNSSGVLQWSFLYGGTNDEEGYDIIQTTDNGFMVAGWTASSDGNVTGYHGTSGSDFWILKLSSTGTLTWNKCYGGTSDDKAAAMVQTQDGNFYVAGTTSSANGDVSGNHGTNADFWLIKIAATGTLLNQKCIGGTGYDEGINIALTSDNGCILCGRTSSTDGDAIGYHGGDDMLIAKISSSFVVEWSKCYGGTETEECNAIVQLSDGTYAALGYTSTHNNGDVTGHHGSQGSDDFWLLKLTSTGAITWAKCYGGDGDDQANGLIKTSDGGFAMCGLTNSTNGDVAGFHNGGFFDPDIWICKVNASGTFQWQRCCGGSGQDESFNVFEEGTGTFVITGFTYSSNYDVTNNRGSADGWILKVTNTSSVNSFSFDDLINIYPNPANDKIEINSMQNASISLVNYQGEILETLNVISTQATFDVSRLVSGIYFLKIKTEKGLVVRKLVKQ